MTGFARRASESAPCPQMTGARRGRPGDGSPLPSADVSSRDVLVERSPRPPFWREALGFVGYAFLFNALCWYLPTGWHL